MSKKILLVSGHLPSDVRGQMSGGEGKLNIELVHLIEKNLKQYCELTVYPDNRDLYKDLKQNNPVYDIRNYDYVLEIHFNSYDGRARGSSIQIHESYKGGITVEKRIINNIAAFGFKKRGTDGIVRRSDLLVMNRCLKYGVDHALLETCFADNKEDISIYEKNKEAIGRAVANGIIDGFGLKNIIKTDNKKSAEIVNCTVLNVRMTPNGRVTGTLKRGNIVEVTGKGKDSDGDVWAKIKYNNLSGYVWPKYLK